MSRRSVRVAVLMSTMAGLVAATVVMTPSALARPIDRGTFHDEFSSVVEDFCGQPGLTVTEDFVVDGRFMVNLRGSGEAPYFIEHLKFTQTDTNAQGDFVRGEF